MKRFTAYLAYAFAACLSCFSMSALAEPVSYVYRAAVALAELPGAGFKRMEMTLAVWRTGGQSNEDLKNNLIASSNHFVMTTAKPLAVNDFLIPC